MNDEMAIVCCHFNPCDYESPRRNLRRFADELGHDFLLVEAALPGQFQFGDLPHHLPIELDPGAKYHWYKESLLNIGIRALPPEIDKIAWIDADLLFDSQTWYEDAVAALETYDVIQLCDRCVWHKEDGSFDFDQQSWGRVMRDGDTPVVGYAHPGFAWAARREAIPTGLLDRAGFGSADTHMALAWSGQPLPGEHHLSDEYAEYVRDWRGDHPVRVGCINNTARHLWHGEHTTYTAANLAFRRYGYCPMSDLEMGQNGLPRWSQYAPAEVGHYMQRAFELRWEDGR